MGVAIEAAEVMEHFLWSTGAESAAPHPDRGALIAQEMGDVLIYFVRLSRVLDVDLVAAARDKLLVNREKYPVAKAKGSGKKYLDLE